MINIVVIGEGDCLREHLKAWKKTKDVNVTCVIDLTIEISTEIKRLSKLKDLRDIDVDAIDICVNRENIVDKVCDVMGIGQTIISDITNGEFVQDICSEHSVPLLYLNTLQFQPAFENATKQIKEEAIGKPGIMRIAIKEPRAKWDKDIFQTTGIGIIAWIYEAFGEVLHVYTKGVSAASKHDTSLDYAVAILKMKNGAIVHLELTCGGNNHFISYELTGDQGMLDYDSKNRYPITMETHHHGVEVMDKEPPLIKSVLERQFENIAQSIRDQSSPVVSNKTVAYTYKVVKALGESMQTKKSVSIRECE